MYEIHVYILSTSSCLVRVNYAILSWNNPLNVEELQSTLHLQPLLHKGHLSTTKQPLFLADSPYTDSCLNLSTLATFFFPQCGCFEEVQL